MLQYVIWLWWGVVICFIAGIVTYAATDCKQPETKIVKPNQVAQSKKGSLFSPTAKNDGVYSHSNIGAYCINGNVWLVSNGGNMSQMLTGDTSTAGGLSVVKCTGGTTLELINGEYK